MASSINRTERQVFYPFFIDRVLKGPV